MKNTKGSLILLLTAFIWGTAFVAQDVGMDHIKPFTFNCIRNFVGALALLPVIVVMGKMKKEKAEEDKKALWMGGVSCGIVLAVASTLQQVGIQYTTSGKAGFITALYIIFVPLFSLFTKKKPKPTIWISVLLAVVGMYLLCVKESLTINRGDFYIFLCAIAFTFHIMVIDHFSPRIDGVKMSCIQFFVCGCICLVLTAFFETPTVDGIMSATVPILYTGVMSSGVAYTLQIIGQKYTSPALATLVMSLESVFAALAGWVLLGQGMTSSEIFGSILMFCGILIAQFV
ncbi:MAG: DMT family transporter [Ruminococcaceae bacterium]|nr:DMT family transporter [Oscillospiraceae bacterium]